MNKPNILIFMTDQQRGKSIFPFNEAKTPNIDAFCKEGVTFTNAHTIAPHCCPSRASFFSGLYPSQHGVWNNIGVGNTLSKGLYEDTDLFSEFLKEDGYTTIFNGKWHVSYYDRPNDKGFDHISPKRNYIKLPFSNENPPVARWQDYDEFVPEPDRGPGDLYREGYPMYTHYGVKENPYGDTTTVDEAIQMFKTYATPDNPWCHYIGTIGPHDPYMPPQKYLDMYKLEDISLPDNFHDSMADKPNLYRRTQDRFGPLTEDENREAILHYLAYCTYEDDLFGQVMEALDQSGQKDNTLVLFTSDHGDYMGEHRLWCKGLPCFEGGYHIPAVFRWPNGIKNPGRIVDDLVSITDFGSTLLEAAGLPQKPTITAKSLYGYLVDTQKRPLRDAHFSQTNGNELYGIQRSIITKEWKYVYNGFDYDELYDLSNDPGELNNLAEDASKKLIIRELAKSLWSFAKETNDACINPYIMVSLAPFGPGIVNEE